MSFSEHIYMSNYKCPALRQPFVLTIPRHEANMVEPCGHWSLLHNRRFARIVQSHVSILMPDDSSLLAVPNTDYGSG